MLSGLRGGIGWRLMIRVLFFSGAVTLALTLIQLYVDYRRDVQEIDLRMAEIDSVYSRSLGDGLWRLDSRQLRFQVEGVLHLPDISYVELRELTDRIAPPPFLVAAGSHQANAPVHREFRIFFADHGSERLLGILRVEATYDPIYRRLLDTAVVIMINQGVKTFVVSFFILLIVHRLITRHLTAIATSLRGYSFRGSQAPLLLERRPPRPADELDHLVGAFNQMYTREQVAYGELLRAEAGLRLQVELLQQLPVSAWTLKPDGTPDFVNQVWLEFTGQTLDFVRSHPEAWMTAIHPEDREFAAKTFWKAVQSGQGFAFETRTLRARDGVYRRHLQQAVVLRDEEGKVLKFVGTTTDIDDQKRAEEALRHAAAELAHANRIAIMGHLTAAISHEINQPIAALLTNAQTAVRWLTRQPPNVEKARPLIDRVISDANRTADIVSGIREFSKKTPVRPQALNVNETILEVLTLAHAAISEHRVATNTELAKDLPRLSADKVQLQQVILNLIMNAIEAMSEVEGPRELLIGTCKAESGAVLVKVSDSGPGLPPDRARVFEAFYTTKATGLGMGLAICRSIVEAHGGQLWATPNEPRGALFCMALPVDDRLPE